MLKEEKIEVLRERENLGDKREKNTRSWREWRTASKDNEIMLEDKEKSSSNSPSLIDVHSLEMRPIIRRPRLVFTMQEMPAKHAAPPSAPIDQDNPPESPRRSLQCCQKSTHPTPSAPTSNYDPQENPTQTREPQQEDTEGPPSAPSTASGTTHKCLQPSQTPHMHQA